MPEPAQPDSPNPSLSVLVLVGDALRRDALAMRLPTGGPTAFTRRLDQGWIRLERCYAAAPWTLPASTSLLTATDPFVHEHWSHRHTLTAESMVPAFPTAHRGGDHQQLGAHTHVGPFHRVRALPLDLRHHGVVCRRGRVPARADGRWRELLPHGAQQPAARLLPARRPARYERWFPERHDYAPIGYRVLAWKGVVHEQARMRRTYDASVLRLHEELDALIDAAPLGRTIVLVLADHGEGFEPELAVFTMVVAFTTTSSACRARCGCRRTCPIRCAPGSSASPRATTRSAWSTCSPRCSVCSAALYRPGSRATMHSGSDGEHQHRVLRIEDQRYLYLASRLRLNTNAQGKNMSRVAKLRNRAWRATVARRHVLQGFVDGRWKLVVTEFVAPSTLAARAGSWWLARQHNGHPFVVVRGRSWFGVELFDVDTDPGERTNRLLGPGARDGHSDRGDRGDLDARVMATVDAYRAGDLTPHLADLLN